MKRYFLSFLILILSLQNFCQTVLDNGLYFKYDSITGIVNMTWNSFTDDLQNASTSNFVKINGKYGSFSLTNGTIQLTRNSWMQMGFYYNQVFSNFEFNTKIKVLSGSSLYPTDYIDIWLNTENFGLLIQDDPSYNYEPEKYNGVKFEYGSGKWSLIEYSGIKNPNWDTIQKPTTSLDFNNLIGSENDFKFKCSEDTIKVYINNVFQKSVYSSRKNGKIGIFLGKNVTQASLNCFKVTPLLSSVAYYEILRNDLSYKKLYTSNFSDTLKTDGNYQYKIITHYSSGNNDTLTSKIIKWNSVYFSNIVIQDGKSVSFSASLSSTKKITAAEYFIDKIGTNGTGISFSSTDGSFDELTENIQAQIKINAPTDGINYHIIYFHAKNENNVWSTILEKEFIYVQESIITVPDNYSTIQEAIDRSTPGSSIFVRAGDYKESLKINKSIKLFGQSNKSRIYGIQDSPKAITITNTAYVEIHDLLFTGYSGIRVDSCDHLLISGCIFSGNRGYYSTPYGIDITRSSNNLIENCDFSYISYFRANRGFYESYGILLEKNSNNNMISNCKIHNLSSSGGNCVGVYISESNNNTIYNSSIYNNQGGSPSCGTSYGILVLNSSKTLISNNNIYGNISYINSNECGTSDPSLFGCGIKLNNTSGDTIRNNIIKNNYTKGYPKNLSYGILITGSSKPVIGSTPEMSNVIMNAPDKSYTSCYNVANLTGNNINALYNYWGTEDLDSIGKTIYDCGDNVTFACVYYNNPSGPLFFLSEPVLQAFIGEPYIYSIEIEDFSKKSYSIMADTIPSWLTLNSYSYTLSGIPTISKLGPNRVVLKAHNEFDTTFQSFTINVTSIPKFSDESISDISDSSVIYTGKIDYYDYNKISEAGICWSATTNLPQITDNHVRMDLTQGSYTTTIKELNELTKYYARTYAIINGNVYYGNIVSFETSIMPLSVFTGEAISITDSTAEFVVVIKYNGICWFKEMGICWNTTGNPLYTDNYAITNSKEGHFSILASNLQKNTRYYIRAFGLLSNDSVYYGNEVSFISNPNYIGENNLKLNFLIFPNPSKGEIFIKDSIYNGIPYTIKVVNSFGIATLQKELNNEIESIKIKSPGMYYIILSKGRSSIFKKIIVL